MISLQDEIQLLVTGMALGLCAPVSKLLKGKPSKENEYDTDEELMFRLEEESLNELNNHGPSKIHNADLSMTGRGASFNDGPGEKFLMRHHLPQSGSLKLGSAGRPHRIVGSNAGHVSASIIYVIERETYSKRFLTRKVQVRERYGVEMTPLSYVPGGSIRKYLGNLNFFFIRESTSIRESGGVSGFVHSFITEVGFIPFLYTFFQ